MGLRIELKLRGEIRTLELATGHFTNRPIAGELLLVSLDGVESFNDSAERLSKAGGIITQRRNEGYHNGIEIINTRTSYRKKFGR